MSIPAPYLIMLAATILTIASLITLASAHFQMQFPIPRGPFVEDNEPTFCDGYTDVTPNRTIFPLNGGFFSLNSEHTDWVIGVTLSTKQNATAFTDFTTITPFSQETGEGLFCFPFDLLKTNATGLADGQNVTLEWVFNGGDGTLFQCADLTLSSTATIPASVSCTNGTTSASATGASATATSPASTGSSTPKPSAAQRFESGYLAFVLALVGAAAVV
ncbi:hypothetical protein B0H11DRAFT_2132194 [Mycena galericulata]|nr:hypothetical protein B0H11DRAFT_2132194 [Mycena galericulata]